MYQPNPKLEQLRAQQERDRVDDDRLAGAGFTGQGVQPGAEMDVYLVNQSDVSYKQFRQHAIISLSAVVRAV